MRGNRLIALAVVALLAGCSRDEPRSSDYEIEDQGGFEAPEDEKADIANRTAPAAPAGWRIRSEAAGPAAIYSDAEKGPAFAIRCDRARKQIAIQLGGGAAGSQAGIQIVTATGEAELYEGRVIGGAQPRIQARTPFDDPFLEVMAASGAQLAVSASGDGQALMVPGGSAIRRVVEGCRAPVATVQGDTFAGTNAEGVPVRVTLGSAAEARFRMVEQSGEPPRTIVGSYSRLTGERGPIIQLVPDDGSGTIFLEQIAPDTLVYRTASNDADPALDAKPLKLVQPLKLPPLEAEPGAPPER